MDNRFGLKDLFLMLLVVLAIVIVSLSMVQNQRNQRLLQSIDNSVADQKSELLRLRRMVQQGVRVAGGSSSSSTQPSDPTDPFVHVKAAQAMEGYALGDWLVTSFSTKVAALTPFVGHDLYSRIVRSRIIECLAYNDPDTLDYVPLLAKSWQQSADGLTITFQLREGVTFSDGQPFTADDVVFSFEWVMNPAIAAPRERAYYERITSVTKTGPHQVVFKFKEPYYESFGLASGMDIIPRHFYSKYTPQQFNSSPGLVMGTGPYRLKTPTGWHPGERIELLRNENYWGEPGPFDKLVWYEIEQDSTALIMFRNGEIDMFSALPEQYRELLKDQAVLDRTTHFEYLPAVTSYSYIGWNQKRGGKPTPFADKRVRQAMTLLCDRQRLVDEVLLGYGQVASGPFSSLGKQANPAIEPWPHDRQRAIALLKEAGYEDRNNDGILESPDGRPFRFALTYGSKSPMIERIALFYKDSCARAKIAVDLDPADWPIMQGKMKNRDFDAITAGWGGSIEGDLYQIFHSSQIKDNADNFISYANPELDAVIDQARSCVDEAKRMPLWQKAHAILHEDQPYTYLFNSKALVFVDKRIQNVRQSRLGLNYPQRFVAPIPWFVPRPMQKWSR